MSRYVNPNRMCYAQIYRMHLPCSVGNPISPLKNIFQHYTGKIFTSEPRFFWYWKCWKTFILGRTSCYFFIIQSNISTPVRSSVAPPITMVKLNKNIYWVPHNLCGTYTSKYTQSIMIFFKVKKTNNHNFVLKRTVGRPLKIVKIIKNMWI